MNAIDEIRERLRKYPDVPLQIIGNTATVPPASDTGFTVSLVDNAPQQQYIVSFDGWHEEYDDAERALEAFGFGLSDACRLRVGYRGTFAYVWTVEEKTESGEWAECGWIGCCTTGLLVAPFWRKKREVCLQNTLRKTGG